MDSVLGKGGRKMIGLGIKGKGKDKLQGDVEFLLIQCMKFYATLVMKEMRYIENEEDKIAAAQERMKACRLHLTGDHSLCSHENAKCHDRNEFILKDRAEFGAEQRDQIVQKLFVEKVETAKWVKEKIIRPGNTSDNENYHSLVVTRGLINKDAKIDVEHNTIDAKYALATYFFNFGAQQTFRTLFNQDEDIKWKICDQSLRKLGQYEKRARTNSIQMSKKKSRELAKRSKQAKWQCNPRHLREPGTYVTVRQKRKMSSSSVPIKNCPKRKK